MKVVRNIAHPEMNPKYSPDINNTYVLNPVRIDQTQNEIGCGKLRHFQTSKIYGIFHPIIRQVLISVNMSSLVITYS